MSGGRRRDRAIAPLLALLTLLAVLLGAAPAGAAGPPGNGASVVAEEQVGPHLVDLTVQSPALGRTAKVRLLTPNGWERRHRGDRWPVFYLLHGCCDTYDSWTRETDVEELRQLREVLVVLPEAGPVGWYSDWCNHGAGGPPAWETFHLRELRRLLERD
jgi:S-formylglutathione hydrolase FrmB